MNSSIFLLLLLSLFGYSSSQGPYPVPLPPGGRNAVHGWLILPIDQDEPTDPSTPVSAYFSHHTPEFWTDSPHNFQIILFGTLVPFETVNNDTQIIPIPYPPSSNMLVDEFTITPPGPFSLNDLITGRITELFGVVYNGSFDTTYERYALSIATLNVKQLTTSVYLNISSAIVSYPEQRYYSYPRSQSVNSQGEVHLYLAHQIHAAPDFDQVIHAVVPVQSCVSSDKKGGENAIVDFILNAGSVWIFPNTTNTVTHRLRTGNALLPTMTTTSGTEITCKMLVVEEIHCVVGPAFADRC